MVMSLETMVDVCLCILEEHLKPCQNAVVPQKRDLKVRIGAPVRFERSHRGSKVSNVPQESRVITRLARECVAALQRDDVL